MVHRKHFNSCPRDVSFSPHEIIIPFEVFKPGVVAWIEKSRHLPGVRINAGQVRPFVSVAPAARKCQVLFTCYTRMLSSDDVINHVAEFGQSFWKMTILAQALCSLANFSCQCLVHFGLGGWFFLLQ